MTQRRYYVYAMVTEPEHTRVQTLAKARGLSMADFVRRAVNSLLLDEGDDTPLLEEKLVLRGRPRRTDAA